MPDAVMETKGWGNRRGPEEGWGWERRHFLAHPVAHSPQLIVSGGSSEEPSWGGRMGLGRRQRLLTELGRVGARAAPHEVRHSFAIDFPGLRQTGARM